MQPETEPKTKDNLEASRENKKKILDNRDFSAVEQWDHLAQTLIRKELAPKGFSEIKRGPWRGKVQANIPFLPKHTVDRTGKIAAQLVRAYREKVLVQLNKQIGELGIKDSEAHLAACHFWEFGKKRALRRTISNLSKLMGQMVRLSYEIENIGIK